MTNVFLIHFERVVQWLMLILSSHAVWNTDCFLLWLSTKVVIALYCQCQCNLFTVSSQRTDEVANIQLAKVGNWMSWRNQRFWKLCELWSIIWSIFRALIWLCTLLCCWPSYNFPVSNFNSTSRSRSLPAQSPLNSIDVAFTCEVWWDAPTE